MEEKAANMLTKIVTVEKFKHCLDLIHVFGGLKKVENL